jgi:hypothetical protein
MATERGNLPPLHPIFEQLSQALAKQKAAERLENPSPRKHVVSPKREYMQDWRKKNPEKHRQNVDRWQHSEKGKAYKAAWQQENRRRKKKGTNERTT